MIFFYFGICYFKGMLHQQLELNNELIQYLDEGTFDDEMWKKVYPSI